MQGHKSNRSKGSVEDFGYSTGDQCIEFTNNNANLGKFKSTGTEGLAEYKASFEFRFPDIEVEEYTWQMFADLKTVVDWVSSTDTTIEGLTPEQIAARRTKFRNEFSQYFEQNATIYYYIYTHLFLMVDQRQKNMMMQKYASFTDPDGVTRPATKWFFAIYDSDKLCPSKTLSNIRRKS